MTRDLHPRGTLRARFEPTGDADVFRRLGVGARRCDLGDQGLYLAEELVSADRWLGGSDPEALGILVLALMIAQRQGSTRLPLDPKGQLRALVRDILRVAGLDTDDGKLLKRIASLTGAPGFNSVIGAGDAHAPLVVDDGCLYTERARHLEQRVATALAARLGAPETAPAGLPRGRLSEEQARAVDVATTGKLAIVTGGPGSGKTMVIAAIVRAFVQLGVPADRVALAAPTGKAANRLTELVARELAGTELAERAPAALTLHRLLGYRGDGVFAHHAKSPLPVGAVIVDEASMIDLELAAALLAALPPDAPLVLVGDAHQLPAVDAGQILADLATGPRVAVLSHSYRMDAADPRGRAVLEAARAVHAGDAHRLVDKAQPLAIARTPGRLVFEGVEWVHAPATQIAEAVWHHFDGPRAQRIANDLVFRFEDGRVAADQAGELDALWQLASRARILAVTRELPTGARALNAHLHTLALARMTVAGRPDFVPGEPVMITANDHQRGLYNGDQGLIIRADEALGGHHYRAVFRVGGALLPFAIEALRDRLELSWALTVHKSQGSELDAVALVLPDEDLPLVTRELVYTGITRARTSVVICGSRQAIIAAGKRRALRESGLAARIRASLNA